MKEEITTMGERGQVVIPKSIREKLKLTPRSKFLIVGYDDIILLKKIILPDISDEFKKLVKAINKKIAKYGELSKKDIEEEVKAYRKSKGR